MISDFRSIFYHLHKLRVISLRLLDSAPERPYTFEDLTGREARTALDVTVKLGELFERRLHDLSSQNLALVLIVYIDYLGFNLSYFQGARTKFSQDKYNWYELLRESKDLLAKRTIVPDNIPDYMLGITDLLETPKVDFSGRLALFKLGIL
jgi:hypothetical protein